ncbi:MAG: Gldg family protein [Planctomycetota bacterium]
MGKGVTTLMGLGIGLVLFFAVNVLSNGALRSWRLDLTEEKLFTLTEGSKNIAAAVDEPIRFKLFVSRGLLDEIPSIKAYAQRVEEMLREYELAADGGIELEVIDPEPYSEAEEAAVEAGLSAAPLGAGLDKLYFGLVASNAVGDRELIRFFDPSQERFLEYEVSRLIHTLDNPKRKIVGVISSLPLAGAGFNPMMPQAGAQRWPILGYIESLYETRTLDDGLTEIPDDVDVLLIAHPKGLADATRFAIDQFVLGGGRTIALVDPWCEADQSGQDPSNPYAAMSADKSSSLPGLLESWGVELVTGRIAADRQNALPVITNNMGAQEQWPMVVWLGLREEAFDPDDAVTSQLGTINIPTAGILRQVTGAPTTFQPLIQTSDDSMDVDVASVRFQPNPKDMLADFVPRKERYTIAARVTGTAQSAFDAPPSPAPDEMAEGEEPPATPEHVTEGSIHVVVVSDADFLDDRFWLRDMGFFGQQKTADNGDFLVNAIENLSGSDDLIAIRGRGQFARPFDRVEEIRRDAEETYLNEERLLTQKLRDAEERINELLQQGSPGSLILTPEVEEEIEKAREEMVETNRQLRDVQYGLRKDIERLGTQLKWINILAVPAVVVVAALALWFVRSRRRPQR